MSEIAMLVIMLVIILLLLEMRKKTPQDQILPEDSTLRRHMITHLNAIAETNR